jgi:predicted GIY-YIG superfamily endonuclease
MGKEKKEKKPAPLHHNVYVIELDKAVLTNKTFLTKNPDHDPAKACLYVGMTGKTPEERFEQHKSGVKSGKFVKKHGLWLRPRFYQRFKPMTFEACQQKEIELAQKLRAAGHAVWQN